MAVIGRQRFGPAEGVGQPFEFIQHRFELLFVIGGLGHRGRHHRQAVRGDDGLRIVASVEAAAGHRMTRDSIIGQVDPVARQRPFDRRQRRFPPGFSPGPAPHEIPDSPRFTRLTNAFSKKLENHFHALAPYFMFYNFVRIHKTLKVSPAMAAKVTDRLWSMEDIAEAIDARTAAPKRPATYRKRAAE